MGGGGGPYPKNETKSVWLSIPSFEGKRTIDTSAGLVSSIRALRRLRRSLLRSWSRLLKTMLRWLLVLRRRRCQTGTTASLIGHYTSKKVICTMS